MHPLLDRDRFLNCEDLIDALEECHKSPFFDTVMGKCSTIKVELSQCLHQNRLEHDRQEILKRMEKNKSLEEKRKQRYEEEYGENGYLKKVIDKEYQLRQAAKNQSSADNNN